MSARPGPAEQQALVVENISKFFHLPRLPLWKRMLGARVELPAPGELPATGEGEKAPVAAAIAWIHGAQLALDQALLGLGGGVVLLCADQRAVCGVHRAGRRGADRPSALAG